jgi:hypothetical protein
LLRKTAIGAMTQTDTCIQAHKIGPASAAWERLLGQLLQRAIASFLHAGTLRVVTSGGDEFTVLALAMSQDLSSRPT